MSEREAALAEIAALAREHGLSSEEVRRALDEPAAPSEPRGLVGRALGYLGGTFVFAGLCVFVGTFWDDMNSAERIAVTLGSGIVALVLSHMAAVSPQREKLATPLYLMAVILQPAGLLIAFAELADGGEPLHGPLAVSAVMLVQCLFSFARLRRSVPLFFAFAFGCVLLGTLLELLDADLEVNGLAVGITCFLMASAVQLTRHAAITPFWFFVAAALLQVSLFEILEGEDFEMGFVALPCALVYLSTILRSRTLLAAGTAGMLAYIGYFTGQHFADSLGWPIALILIGAAMMALATVAVRIHRRYIRPAA